MKNLLRKIFFWDNPAQGAFFHAMAMLAAPWCISAFLCFFVSFVLTRPSLEESFWGLAIVLLFLAMPVVAVIEAVAGVICLVRLFCLRRNNRQGRDAFGWPAVCMGALAALCWFSAIAVVLAHGEYGTAYIVLALALALCGYACFGFFLKCFKMPLMGRGVKLLWMAVAVVWIGSTGLAIHAKCLADRHCAELENRFGRPPTHEARDARIARECRLDAVFWQKARDILDEHQKTIEMPFMSFKTASPDELSICRAQLESFTDFTELERMFDAPPPLLSHEDYLRLDVHEAMLNVFSGEMWRLNFALADKDMDSIMEVFRRISNLLECQSQMAEYSFARESAGWLFDRFLVNFLERLLSSQLPTDEQLDEIKDLLEKREPACKSALQGGAYNIAIRFNDHLEMDFEDLRGEELPLIFPLFPLLNAVDACYWEKPTWSRRMAIHAGRFLLPQFFWFSANDKRIVFKVLTHFPSTVPEGYCGSLFLAMDFHLDWMVNTYYYYQKSLAQNRALRCAIDAVLEYRQTHAYPASLPSPLEDPLTGGPLKYRVGECWEFDYDNQQAYKVQAIQIWSLGPNKTDDEGVHFPIPGDEWPNRRDDIRVLIPLR